MLEKIKAASLLLSLLFTWMLLSWAGLSRVQHSGHLFFSPHRAIHDFSQQSFQDNLFSFSWSIGVPESEVEMKEEEAGRWGRVRGLGGPGSECTGAAGRGWWLVRCLPHHGINSSHSTCSVWVCGKCSLRSSYHGSAVTIPASIHEDAGSIPGLAQWVNNLTVLLWAVV